jgi:hypothetical protein
VTRCNSLRRYEGNVKSQQVEALQVKVEVLGKKIATLLQLLPALGERFGVSMKQMMEQVPPPPPPAPARIGPC